VTITQITTSAPWYYCNNITLKMAAKLAEIWWWENCE